MEILNALTNSLLVDSLDITIPRIEVIAELPDKSLLQRIYYFAMIIIALANVFLVIYIFRKNKEKDINAGEKNRKINLLKTLILDYNMDKFYNFFGFVYEKAKLLNTSDLKVESKITINNDIKDLASEFRQSFIDLFIAIDGKLYDDILKKIDSLIDGLTNTIFDEGVNLSHKPKFDELVTNEIRKSKTEIIRSMFSYSGE